MMNGYIIAVSYNNSNISTAKNINGYIITADSSNRYTLTATVIITAKDGRQAIRTVKK